MCRDSY